MVVVFVFVGAVVGGLVGEAMRHFPVFFDMLPYLAATTPVFSISPTEIDLFAFKFTLGLSFTPNLMSMLGIVLALVLFRRY